MTNDALERELSRVLHELPDEPGAHPGRLREVQGRARRIRLHRYATVAATVVAVVAVIAAVPLSLRGGHDAGQRPVPANDPSTWPTRGSLSGSAAVRANAVAAWQRALTNAHRGRLTQPAHEVYADHVAGVGVVVVLTGVEPRGSDRTVVVSGADVRHLSVYTDESTSPGAFALLFGQRIRAASGGCPILNPQSARWVLFVLGPPGTTSAHWQQMHAVPPTCRETNSGSWHDIPLHAGAGATTLSDPDVDLRVDGGGSSLDASGVGGRSPVEHLRGRIAGAATVGSIGPAHSTETHGPGFGSVTASPGTRTGDPLGWKQRTDASAPIDAFDANLADAFPDGASSFDVESALALPDGAVTEITVGRGSGGPERLFLLAGRSPTTGIRTYISRPLDSSHVPTEISAIVAGRDGHRWLYVAGAPGVASIEYRPAGAAHWHTLGIYQSTAFARVTPGSHAGDRIRLRLADGRNVYEGPIDTRDAVGTS